METKTTEGKIGHLAWKIENKTLTISKRCKVLTFFIPAITTINPPWKRHPFTTVIIKDGVKSIEDYSFSDCKDLVSINIPKSVKRIGENAFAGCYNLKTVNFEELRVKIIEVLAFANCQSLESITIPKSVEFIEHGAFGGCYGLTEIFNHRKKPQEFKENTFYDVDKTNCVLRVPPRSIEDYRSKEGWRDFEKIERI